MSGNTTKCMIKLNNLLYKNKSLQMDNSHLIDEKEIAMLILDLWVSIKDEYVFKDNGGAGND